MAIMSDALAKEAHHEIRMDESSGAIASVQGDYTVIFSCDGKPPSTVYTEHLPCTFMHVPGPASLAPKVTHAGEISLNFHSKLFKANALCLTNSWQAQVHHYDAKALLKKWDAMHVTVWSGMVGWAEASHEHAVARCIQGPDGKDVGRKSFCTTGCRTRMIEEYEGRKDVLAITVVNKDSSESVRAV